MNAVILALTVALAVPFFLFGVWVDGILQAARSERGVAQYRNQGEDSQT